MKENVYMVIKLFIYLVNLWRIIYKYNMVVVLQMWLFLYYMKVENQKKLIVVLFLIKLVGGKVYF